MDADGTAQVLSILEPSDVEQLGGLPNEAIIGQLVGASERGKWRRLRRSQHAPELIVNQRFVEFLNAVIARWAPLEPGFADDVERQHDGWIYLLDARTPTPEGRVPVEDIIGAFEVRAGRLVPNSYQPSGTHELLTEHGLFQLTPFLKERLVSEVKKLPPVE